MVPPEQPSIKIKTVPVGVQYFEPLPIHFLIPLFTMG